MEFKGHMFQINDNNRKVLFLKYNTHAKNDTVKKSKGHVKDLRKYVKGHDRGHVIKTYVTT